MTDQQTIFRPEQDPRMHELLHALRTTPIIDHHAHNILLPSEQEAHPLLSITTEATGEALQHTYSTLSHIRAVKQLAEILQCEPTWDHVQAGLDERRNTDAWVEFCFKGIETVLIDDGLDKKTIHPYNWHDRFTRSPCKRIVRIETIAEEILTRSFKVVDSLDNAQRTTSNLTDTIIEQFTHEINRAIDDPNVAGFKSVICYRTGLAIPQYGSPNDEYTDFQRGIDDALSRSDCLQKAGRLQDERLSPAFVNLTARLIARSKRNKPFQFHTGLGDNDIRLRFSSPSHLQPFIEQHPSVPVVLLHASYPFTREAGYLASTYPNVYLDIGEIFPMVSEEGQETVIREALELCPSEKLLWSTDGHWFPETYLLATLQVRQALEKVLCGYVNSQMITVTTAVKIAQDLLFNTSNLLYHLELKLKPFESPLLIGGQQDLSDQKDAAIEDIEILKQFLSKEPTVKYLRLQWVDYTATVRVRILPIGRALQLFAQGKSVDVTKAVLGLLQTDVLVEGFRATGQYQLYPRFNSLHLGARPGYATVQCEFRDDDGQPVLSCPKTFLRTVVERAQCHNIEFLVGFEIEVVLMAYKITGNEVKYGVSPVTQGQSWSAARALHDEKAMEVVEAIIAQLEKSGVAIQQFHPESAPGQFEFVMDPMEPSSSVDALVCARDIIASVASKHAMRATLVPKAYPGAAGTGSHAHISMTPAEPHEHFLAGVLENLSAISAITYPNVACYERVADSEWTGGTWITWGTQNRETPVRYIAGSRYEIKFIDGLANPYLAVGAILGAGLQGVLDAEPLKHKDCLDDPAKLSLDERRNLGILYQIPRSIEDALKSFRRNSGLRTVLGDEVYKNYLAVKEAEVEMLKPMKVEERRQWLIERY